MHMFLKLTAVLVAVAMFLLGPTDAANVGLTTFKNKKKLRRHKVGGWQEVRSDDGEYTLDGETYKVEEGKLFMKDGATDEVPNVRLCRFLSFVSSSIACWLREVDRIVRILLPSPPHTHTHTRTVADSVPAIHLPGRSMSPMNRDSIQHNLWVRYAKGRRSCVGFVVDSAVSVDLQTKRDILAAYPVLFCCCVLLL